MHYRMAACLLSGQWGNKAASHKNRAHKIPLKLVAPKMQGPLHTFGSAKCRAISGASFNHFRNLFFYRSLGPPSSLSKMRSSRSTQGSVHSCIVFAPFKKLQASIWYTPRKTCRNLCKTWNFFVTELSPFQPVIFSILSEFQDHRFPSPSKKIFSLTGQKIPGKIRKHSKSGSLCLPLRLRKRCRPHILTSYTSP